MPTPLGIISSAFVPPSAGLFLVDDCDNFTDAPWVIAGSPTIAAAKNGNGFSIPNGSSNGVSFNIPAGKQTDTLTVGCWIKWGTFVATQNVMEFRGDGGTVVHCALRTGSDGSLHIARVGGTAIGGTAPAGTVVVGTWYYLEASVKLHDTIGTATIRVDGVQVVTGTGDTKNTSTGTVFDQFGFKGGASTTTWLIDDVYLRNDATFGLS